MTKLYILIIALAILPLFSFAQYTWEEVEFPDTIEIKMLSFDSTGVLYIATNKGVYYSEDGMQWGQTNLPDYVSYIYINSNNTIYAGMNTLFRSFDLGVTWDSIFFYPQGGINSLYTIGDSIICLGTWGGIFRSGDYGQTWEQPLSTYTAETVNCIAMNSQGMMFAGSTSYSGDLSPGGVYISDDYGETWVLAGMEYYFVSSMVIDSENDIYVGTKGHWTNGGGGVYRSVNNGYSWEQLYNNNLVITMTINIDNEISIGCDTQGYEGGIFLTTDSGDYWQDITANLPTNSFRQVIFSHNNQLYTITNFNDRQLYRTVIPVNVHYISNGNNSNNNFQVYPNPARDKINVYVKSVLDYKLVLNDIFGNNITELKFDRNNEITEIDISKLPSGLYIINYLSSQGNKSLKIIKQ